MTSNFAYIMPKNSLAKSSKTHILVNKIIEKLSEIPNYIELRNNIEAIKMCCIMVEHAVDNKGKKDKEKIDKADIIYQVWTRAFSGMNPTELRTLASHIDYLWENGQIKKRGLWSVFKHSICDWARRRLL